MQGSGFQLGITRLGSGGAKGQGQLKGQGHSPRAKPKGKNVESKNQNYDHVKMLASFGYVTERRNTVLEPPSRKTY